jgi:hypothetical protein
MGFAAASIGGRGQTWLFPRLAPGHRLRQPDLEFSAPLFQRSVEEIIHYKKPAAFVGLQLIDIAVFENAGVNASCSVAWSISSVHFTKSQRS